MGREDDQSSAAAEDENHEPTNNFEDQILAGEIDVDSRDDNHFLDMFG